MIPGSTEQKGPAFLFAQPGLLALSPPVPSQKQQHTSRSRRFQNEIAPQAAESCLDTPSPGLHVQGSLVTSEHRVTRGPYTP